MLRIGETVDRYVVEALIGQGGMAAVYRARHSTLDSLHAIKVLFITAPDIRTRLMREGKVQANLRHQNIVAVTDVLEIQGAPALVMEYVDGPPLDQWLSANEPTLEEALFLFRGVLRGVMAAHERGVIHRDLKPANVLLAPTNEGVVPKVADFGLTKSVKSSSGHTQTGMAMGTPEYMAPEQIRDASDVDERVDMFALGCILYEMVTHQRAFRGPDNVAVFNSIVNGVYEAPKDVVDNLPRNVQMAIKWLLEPDREKRLASAGELFDLLFEENLGPRLNMGTASLKPIPISTTIHEPTPIPAPQSDVATQPPPSRRQVTPGGAGRATPSPIGRLGDSPTQVPVAVPEPANTGVVRLVAPVLLVVLALGAVAWVVSSRDPMDLIQPDGGERVEAPRPTPVAAPENDPAPVAPTPVPGTADPEPQPTQPEAQPTQPEPRPTQPEPRPKQPDPQPTQPDPQPTTQPEPQPVAPSPQPEPEPAGTADGVQVAVTGDTKGVWLVGSAGRLKMPAAVPAGTYNIEADFGDGPVAAGQVGVRDGQPVTLKCDPFFFQCRPQ